MLIVRRGRQRAIRLLALIVLALPLLASPTGTALSAPPLSIPSPAVAASVAFVPNQGQRATAVRFQADIAGGMAMVLDDGLSFALANAAGPSDSTGRNPARPAARPACCVCA